MTNLDLERILREAKPPPKPAGYAQEFAKSVITETQRRAGHTGGASAGVVAEQGIRATFPRRSSVWRQPAFAMGLPGLFLVGLMLFLMRSRSGMSEERIAGRYIEEVERLFPRQLKGIVFDQAGTHLVLADNAEMPESQPVYLKVCNGSNCQRYVTFSGQRISVAGEFLDVLLDGRGDVLLVGEHWLWSSSKPVENSRGYRIEAKCLRFAS